MSRPPGSCSWRRAPGCEEVEVRQPLPPGALKKDLVVTMARARLGVQLRDMLPQLAIVHIAGAGHCIRRDRPATYEQGVRQFAAHTSA